MFRYNSTSPLSVYFETDVNYLIVARTEILIILEELLDSVITVQYDICSTSFFEKRLRKYDRICFDSNKIYRRNCSKLQLFKIWKNYIHLSLLIINHYKLFLLNLPIKYNLSHFEFIISKRILRNFISIGNNLQNLHPTYFPTFHFEPLKASLKDVYIYIYIP